MPKRNQSVCCVPHSIKGRVGLSTIKEREGQAWMSIRNIFVVFLIGFFPVVARCGAFPAYGRVMPWYVSDSLPDSTEASKSKLTLALDYSSNSAFFGRTGGTVKFPFLSPSLTYTSKKGWWLSAGSYHLLNESSISFNQPDGVSICLTAWMAA
jgi:hypothetical protein